MTQALIKGDRVELPGFGSFKMKEYKGYTGRSPYILASSQLSWTIEAIQNCFEMPSILKTEREYE